mmetsp:Transcript_29001/g.84800  ORF Transcript_29001/g.84800 Transcript_29001/m.84800 type:complete len:80 (+) Transcript_29001:239-478(+)
MLAVVLCRTAILSSKSRVALTHASRAIGDYSGLNHEPRVSARRFTSYGEPCSTKLESAVLAAEPGILTAQPCYPVELRL